MDDLIAKLRAEIETKQRELDFDLTQPGGMCDAAGGHWVEDEVQRHLTAHRELISKYEAVHAFYNARKEAPAGEVYGLYTAITLIARGYGIDG